MCHPSEANDADPPSRSEGSGKLRILALNMCLLPAGINFSGTFLLDGNDRKVDRLNMLLVLIEDYDVVLLNEMWGCMWSSHHSNFIANARAKGFNVVSDPIGAVSNTGNMILSRMPLRNATSMVFKNTAGWQSIVSNGVLHASTTLPNGVQLHLFTTHLQCTTAPPTAAADCAKDARTARVLNMVEGGIDYGLNVRQRQLHEIKAFVDRTVCLEDDAWLIAGDLNIEGGSEEYYDMVDLFGREALGAPAFKATYNTESFLTPPGWRGVEYSVCLDHVLTNLRNVDDFAVLADNISDHRGLAVTIDCPRAARRGEVRVGEGSVCITPPRFKLPPSMVTWAPAHTLCREGGGGGGGSSTASNSGSEEGERGKTGRRRRRGGAVGPSTPVTPSEFTHELAEVEVLPTEKGHTNFLARAAWSPGQVAARLLMPGAVEFVGAVSQTQAYAALKTRLIMGAQNSANAAVKSAQHAAPSGGRNTTLSIPTSQL